MTKKRLSQLTAAVVLAASAPACDGALEDDELELPADHGQHDGHGASLTVQQQQSEPV